MRVESTPDRLEISFSVASGGCLVFALVITAIPLGIAAFMLAQGEPHPAIASGGLGGALIAIILLSGWVTRSRCVLDRVANEAWIERGDLVAEEGVERASRYAAVGPLDRVTGAEVLSEQGSEGAVFFKPALRIRGQKSIALTSYGSGSRTEADAAVRAILEWLGKPVPDAG